MGARGVRLSAGRLSRQFLSVWSGRLKYPVDDLSRDNRDPKPHDALSVKRGGSSAHSPQ